MDDIRIRYALTIPNVGMFADARLLSDMAVRAEAAGWDGCFVWDHLLYHHADWPVVDPWVAVTAAAVRTERVRIGVLLAALARYRPWRLAKTVATLDQLSGGRVVFGAGLGSIPAEYGAFGEPSDARDRADRLDEALELVDRFWRGEEVHHAGRHFEVDVPELRPRPVQEPRIPIWIGGRWPARRPFQRAARWDGVMPTHADYPNGTTLPAKELAEIVDYVRSHRTSAGPLDIVTEGETPPNPAAAAERIRPYRDMGVTWWVEKLGWWRGDLDAALQRIDAGPPTL
jgi:alkanesulfonate monooxygenase SsuD/methylene tetrahydromethanopterin reductase-like flavin-dependent oxidoreductase (luciferase family)